MVMLLAAASYEAFRIFPLCCDSASVKQVSWLGILGIVGPGLVLLGLTLPWYSIGPTEFGEAAAPYTPTQLGGDFLILLASLCLVAALRFFRNKGATLGWMSSRRHEFDRGIYVVYGVLIAIILSLRIWIISDLILVTEVGHGMSRPLSNTRWEYGVGIAVLGSCVILFAGVYQFRVLSGAKS